MAADPGIVLVHSQEGDWVSLYQNGVLITENHRLDPEDVLDALGIGYRSYEAPAKWYESGDEDRDLSQLTEEL